MCICHFNSNCDQEQPFQLIATLGQEVTFNASIAFVDGGSQNQQIEMINLIKGPDVLYNCNILMDECSRNNSRIQADVSSVNEHNMSVLITLGALNSLDMGQYEVEIIAVSFLNSIERKSIFFSLTVECKCPSLTLSSHPLPSYLSLIKLVILAIVVFLHYSTIRRNSLAVEFFQCDPILGSFCCLNTAKCTWKLAENKNGDP